MDDALTLIAGLTSGVLVAFLIIDWKTVRPINRLVIIMFFIFASTSSVARVFLYKAGIEPAPAWYLMFINLTLIALSISLIASIWTRCLNK